jgi:hypothetical protein
MCESVSLIASWRWWTRIALATSRSASSTTDDGVAAIAHRLAGRQRVRHVAFVEQRRPVDLGMPGAAEGEGLRWLMASDVCKH